MGQFSSVDGVYPHVQRDLDAAATAGHEAREAERLNHSPNIRRVFRERAARLRKDVTDQGIPAWWIEVYGEISY